MYGKNKYTHVGEVGFKFGSEKYVHFIVISRFTPLHLMGMVELAIEQVGMERVA